MFARALDEVRTAGGTVHGGGARVNLDGGNYVQPCFVTGLAHDTPIVLRETFAPILYVLKTRSLDEAIAWNNESAAGLSSALFTRSMINTFKWLG
jgi:aldehyde dehydrogenase family 7 protein A1